MDWLLVLPAIDQELAASCMASMRVDPARVIVVDNAPQPLRLPWEPGQLVRTGRNLGVARSWNEGAQRVVAEGRDMLVLVSQAIEFGPPGGCDLIEQLVCTDGHGLEVVGPGWHMVAISRTTLETVGPFDEGFWPAYYEDTDYLYRMGLHDLPSPRENGRHWPYVHVQHTDRGQALSVARGLAQPSFGMLADRYRDKWGGQQGAEQYRTPWDSGRPTWWWPASRFDPTDPWQRGTTCTPP